MKARFHIESKLSAVGNSISQKNPPKRVVGQGSATDLVHSMSVAAGGNDWLCHLLAGFLAGFGGLRL